MVSRSPLVFYETLTRTVISFYEIDISNTFAVFAHFQRLKSSDLRYTNCFYRFRNLGLGCENSAVLFVCLVPIEGFSESAQLNRETYFAVQKLERYRPILSIFIRFYNNASESVQFCLFYLENREFWVKKRMCGSSVVFWFGT